MIDIISITFQDEYNFTNSPDFLFGSVLDKIKATIELEVYAIANTVVQVDLDDPRIVFTRAEGSFLSDGFSLGDQFVVEGDDTLNPYKNITYTIKEITDLRIATDTPRGNIGNPNDRAKFYLVSSVNTIDLLYSLARNSDQAQNYFSEIDGSQQRFTATVPSLGSLTSMIPNESSKAWQNGFANVIKYTESDQASNYRQKFVIEHTFWILPMYLDGQLNENTLQLLVPDYFADTESLRYNYEIRGRYREKDPSVNHSTNQENSNIEFYQKPGQVGWYDEYLNGFLPRYEVAQNTVYYEAGTATVLGGIAQNRDTEVHVFVRAINGSVLQANSPYTKVIVHLFRLSTEAQYTTPTKTVFENFLYDRIVLRSDGVALGNGGEFTAAILPGATATVNGELEIIFSVAKDQFLSGTNYLIAVTLHDNTSSEAVTSDRTCIIADIATSDTAFSTGGEFISDTKFYWALSSYQDLDTQLNSDVVEAYVGDEIYSTSILGILKDVAPESHILKKLTLYYQSNKPGFTLPYTLAAEVIDFSTLPSTPDGNGYLYNSSKAYKTSEPLKKIVALKRRDDLDTSTYIFYELQYAQKMRWEEWRSLAGGQANEVNAIGETYGKHNWSQYSLKNWAIAFRIVADIEYANTTYSQTETRRYTFSSPVTLRNFDNSGVITENIGQTLITADIQTYDAEGYDIAIATGQPISIASLDRKINAPGRDTRVVATFTPQNANYFAGKNINQMWAAIRLDVPNTGGETYIEQIDSLSDVLPSISLKSIDDNQKVKMTYLSTTPPRVTVEAIINSTFLPKSVVNYQIQARLGEIAALAELTMDVTALSRTVENGLLYKGRATIIAEGGLPPYQYSQDNVTYQASPEFLPLNEGVKNYFTKDAQGNVVQESVFIGTKNISIGGGNFSVFGVCFCPTNNCFYGAPYDGVYVMKFDPSTGIASNIGPNLGGSTQKYIGTAYCPYNNKIYAAPFNAAQGILIDPATDTVTLFNVPATGGVGGGSKYLGVAFCPTNNKLYFAPNNAEFVAEMDPTNNSIVNVGSSLAGIPANRYFGIAYTPQNGKLYCAPREAGRVLEITPAANSASVTTAFVGDIYSFGGLQFNQPIAHSNGKVYCSPRSADKILEISPAPNSAAVTTKLVGASLGSGPNYSQLVEGGNGRLYAPGLTRFSLLEFDPTNEYTYEALAIMNNLGGMGRNPNTNKLYAFGVYNTILEIF